MQLTFNIIINININMKESYGGKIVDPPPPKK